MNPFPLTLILPDIRSTQNVGSILRTADAAGVERVITCGYTPHPTYPGDPRPPHIADANTRAITKTALGAEQTVAHTHYETLSDALAYLHHNHYRIAALELAEEAVNLYDFHPTGPLALILGNEVEGLPTDILSQADIILEIPMIGRKESLNVAVAAGIALYQLRFGR